MSQKEAMPRPLSELLSDLADRRIQLSAEGGRLQLKSPKGALTPALRDELLSQKGEVLRLLHERQDAERLSLLSQIQPEPTQRFEPFPLTEIQQAYWLGRTSAFNLGNIAIQAHIELDREHLDIERFVLAWQRVIDRHDMLRAIVLPDGRQQVLREVPDYQPAVLDLRDLDPETQEARLSEIREALTHEREPVETWPGFVVQISLLTPEMTRVHFSLDMLHMDGASLRLLFADLVAFYQDPDAALPEFVLTYRDYVLAQEALKESSQYQKSLAYWQEKVRRLPPAPELPLARQPSEIVRPRFDHRRLVVDRDTWSRVKRHISERGVTPAAVLLAAYAEVLALWCRSAELSINVTLFNRLPLHPQVEEIIGDFTSMILLGVQHSPEDSFETRVLRLQEELWSDLEHRQVSGVTVLRELAQLHRDGSGARMPVVFTSFLNLDAEGSSSPTAPLQEMGSLALRSSQTPQVWIDHQVMEDDGHLVLSWEGVEELFPEDLLANLFEAYRVLVQRLETAEIWQRPPRGLLPEEQQVRRGQILAAAEGKEPIPDVTLWDLVVEQVSRRGSELALITPEQTRTYEQLYARANQLGRWLRQRGAGRDRLVAVVLPKGPQQVEAVLGVLACGAAYLPIDPELPTRRLYYLLEHGEVSVVFTGGGLAEALSWPPNLEVLDLDHETVTQSFSSDPLSPSPGESGPRSAQLAYVIYTSGSTGQPKGVMIEHRSAVNRFLDINRRYGIGPGDRMLGVSALHHDLSVYDVWGILVAGATLVLPAADQAQEPAHWTRLARDQRVTLWNSVPAFLQMWVAYLEGLPVSSRSEHLPRDLRWVIQAGDWIPVDLADRLRALLAEVSDELAQGLSFVASGGPTETTIWDIHYSVGQVDPAWPSIPYGRPLSNTRYFVLNEALEPCPDWVPGEMYIGGAGLARGYWRDEEKTSASFIPWRSPEGGEGLPGFPRDGERLYRSGDLGRFRADGELEILGRVDFQVKIRGHRIELGEIESHLKQHAGVTHAVVTVSGDRHGQQHLVGYVVPSQRQAAAQAASETEPAAILDPLARTGFKLAQHGLRQDLAGRAEVVLPSIEIDERVWAHRLSRRRFADRPVTLASLAQLLRHIGTQALDSSEAVDSDFGYRRRYPSAGGLFPIETYLYVEPGRVEDLEGGYYYYHPDHRLIHLSSERLSPDLHPAQNQAIVESSAFTLLLVARPEAVAALYPEQSRDLCWLEAGSMGQLLMEEAEPLQLGLCPLGGMPFEAVRRELRLDASAELAHLLVGGAVASQARDLVSAFLGEQLDTSGAHESPAGDRQWLERDSENWRRPPMGGADERLRFKRVRKGVRQGLADLAGVTLPLLPEPDDAPTLGVRDVRFSPDVLALETLGRWLSCLRYVQPQGMPLPKYRYPSGGGLYPVQVYLQVEPGRVEGLAAGAYVYDPAGHRLVRLSDLEVDRQPASTETEAFRLFLIGKLGAVEPLYPKQGHDFCRLEAGYMGQLLLREAAEHEVGLLPVGGGGFDAWRPAFVLDEDHELVHVFVGGRCSTAPAPAPRVAESLMSLDGLMSFDPQAGTPATPENLPPISTASSASPASEPQKEPQVLSGPSSGIDETELRGFLEDRLPAYMVPQRILVLDRLPLTSNGKVDRKALPAVDAEDASRTVSQQMPRNEIERQLVSFWQDVLGRDGIGIDKSFFELGGTSITMVQVYVRVAEIMDREVAIVELFEHPTVRSLAEHLSGGSARFSQNESQRRHADRRTSGEPEGIAVIGMSGRFPGAPDVATFWENLKNGVESIRGFSDRELLASGLAAEEIAQPGYVKAGAILDGVENFDADFFGYTPREARMLEPQMRLFLECAWEAFEESGYDPDQLDAPVGVYAGMRSSDYLLRHVSGHPEASQDLGRLQALFGTDKDYLAPLTSYKLGLRGPSITVQSACSTSLVAIHLASEALVHRQCDLALAGGVAIRLPQVAGYHYQTGGIFSQDGHCRAFDADASGAVFGNGAGVVMLKRLEEAVADGDQVLAVIRGWAVNNDGSQKVGFTAPSVAGQARVIADAHAMAGIDPAELSYIECHGTGTALGDPIEIKALTTVFESAGSEDARCAIGSVKTNVGHLETAAGVTSFIKTVLMLRHRQLVPSLNFAEPNPRLEIERTPFRVSTQTEAWEASDSSSRLAGVSSFGLGGTNAHVVLEEAPSQVGPAMASGVSDANPAVPRAISALAPLPLLLSGHDEAALRAQAGRWASWLERHPEATWTEVLRTAALHRRHFVARAAIQAESVDEAVAALEALAEGRSHSSVVSGRAGEHGEVIFVFPGQGSQWPGMGAALLEQSEAFAEAVAACDAALRPHTGWSVTAVLRDDSGEVVPPLERVDVVQPALFTMGVGLAAAWKSLGVEPSGVVGSSQGEITAAVVSGALALEDGARIVALRSRLVRRLAGSGGMAVVELPVGEVEQRLASDDPSLSIAVVNTPSSTVVSGDTAAVESWVEKMAEEGIFCRQIDVDYASHCAHVDGLLDELMEVLAGLSPRSGRVPMVSTVTGEPIDGSQLDASYWCRNLRLPVRLDRALDFLLSDSEKIFVEVSAHPVLAMPLTTACADRGGGVSGSLRRDAGDLKTLYRNLGHLHVHGYAVDWSERFDGMAGERVPLPTYPFQRQRYWLDSEPATADVTSAGLAPTDHPFLGAAIPVVDSGSLLLTGRLSLSEQPWLADHVVFDSVLLPGAAMLELAFAAAQAVGCRTVSDWTLGVPLVLDEHEAVHVQLQIDAANAMGQRSLTLFSRSESADSDAPWIRHAVGTLSDVWDSAIPGAELASWPPSGAVAVDLAEFYPRLTQHGLAYGPAFQGLTEAWRLGEEIYGRAVLPASGVGAAGDYGIHPALLDAALHPLVAGLKVEDATAPSEGQVLLPFVWSDVTLYATGASELRVRLRLSSRSTPDSASDSASEATAEVTLTDSAGQTVATVGELRLRSASAQQVRAATRVGHRHLYRVDWQPIVLGEAVRRVRGWVVGGEGRLAASLDLEAVASLPPRLAALDGEAQAPEMLVIDLTAPPASSGDLATIVQLTTEQRLAEIQALLAEPRLSATCLIWVTSKASGDSADDLKRELIDAPLSGLLRSARLEHPERDLRQLHLGSEVPTGERLWQLLLADDEPELQSRAGEARVARWVRVLEESPQPSPWPSEGTVLITGGAGELGQAVGRHLVSAYGVKSLVLTSRRGEEAPGAAELIHDLKSLGADRVRLEACDVMDFDSLQSTLDEISARDRLIAVLHLAGVLDDGLIDALDAERLGKVMGPKVGGAWNLHRLTQDLDLSAFVLFSSTAGVLGSPGQSNYAAASAFLDALARYRHQLGLPAISLAWGLWQQQGLGMTAHLGAAELARMHRYGLTSMSVESALAQLDAALLRPEPDLAPVRLELDRLSREATEAAMMPPLLRGLWRPTLRRVDTSSPSISSLNQRLASVTEEKRIGILVHLVQEEVATVLGLAGPEQVPSDQPIRNLGLDSLMAVELRNLLSARVDSALPATLAFDYPTPEAMAGLLCQSFSDLGSEPAPTPQSAGALSDPQLLEILQQLQPAQLRQSGLYDQLQLLATATGEALEEPQASDSEVRDLDALIQEFGGSES